MSPEHVQEFPTKRTATEERVDVEGHAVGQIGDEKKEVEYELFLGAIHGVFEFVQSHESV